MAEPRATGNTTAPVGKTAGERASLRQHNFSLFSENSVRTSLKEEQSRSLTGKERDIVRRMNVGNPFVSRISEEDMDYIRNNYERLQKYPGDYYVDSEGNDASIGGKIWHRVGMYERPDETDVVVCFETKERRSPSTQERNNGYSVYDYRRKR